MRFLVGIVLMLLLGAIGSQLYRLNTQRLVLDKKLQELEEETVLLRNEGEGIRSDIEYLNNPKNLAKEVKSLFNIRKPEEELFIIVPQKSL